MQNIEKQKSLWGSATVVYQCEGAWDADGKGLGEWDVFSHGNLLNINGATGDVSCDLYRHYEEDIDMLKAGGQNTYRFSIFWAEILPNGRSAVNQGGIDFYNRVIDYCLKQGVEPNMTLFHYDLPEAIAKEGGWESRTIVDAFVEYTRVCFTAFGDRVKLWVIINEPKCHAYCNHMVGNYPPNHCHDFNRYFMTVYHEAIANVKAVAIYHSLKLNGSTGIVYDSSNAEVAPGTKEKERVHMTADLFYSHIILNTACKGKFPDALIPLLRKYGIDTSYIKSEDMLVFLRGKVDFLGLNVYNRFCITDYSAGEMEIFHNNKGAGSNVKEEIRIRDWYETAIDPSAKQNLWGREIYPKCMYNTLMEVKERYGDIPVYITENGHGCYEKPNDEGYVEDDERTEMMQGHIDYMLKAMEDGCNVRGYYAWSTMDPYSWVNGYEKRYGLVRVGFDNHNKRYPKKSYYWFKRLIEDYRKTEEE